MKHPVSLSVCLLGLAILSASAQQPSANQILRDMSDTLAAAQTFRFSATREIDAGLLGDLEGFAGKAEIQALVQRPDKIAIRTEGRKGDKQFIADGRTLTVYDAKTNFFTLVSIPGTIDALADKLDEDYDFTPPLIDFAVSDPYAYLRRDSSTATWLGRGKVGACPFDVLGVECDRIALRGELADAELWIGVKDHLPRKLVATFKLLPKKPQLRVTFRDWNLAATATPADFTFTPPKGATQIEMWTVSKMQNAKRKN